MIDSLVFIIGLLIGSFLNVCIYRIPRVESIVFPSSHCTRCGHELSWFELIPVVSYLALRGRCRSCQTSISIRYPLIELLTGAVFLLLFRHFGLTVPFMGYAFMMAALIVVFFIDLDHMIIPDKIVIATAMAGILLAVCNVFSPLPIYGDDNWWNPFLGALVGSGFLCLVGMLGSLIFKTDEAMGGGDIKIMLPIGLFLGWRLTILTLFLAVLLGGLLGMLLLAFKLTSRKASIPFGPFIVVASLVAVMWGYQIIDFYWSLY